MVYLKIVDQKNEVKFTAQGSVVKETFVGKLVEGDKIQIRLDGTNTLAVQLDESLQESFIYCPNKSFTFTIPTARELQMGYAPNVFQGDEHLISVREIEEDEFYSARNIALNSHDLRKKTGGYPHASANFVTREEPCFYERNAIDGEKNNQGHGSYPYHSWAGGARNDLEYTLDFGTEVEIEKLVFYLRADFKKERDGLPHDSYWKGIDIEFSDGELVHGSFILDRSGLKTRKRKRARNRFRKAQDNKKNKIIQFYTGHGNFRVCGVDAN